MAATDFPSTGTESGSIIKSAVACDARTASYAPRRAGLTASFGEAELFLRVFSSMPGPGESRCESSARSTFRPLHPLRSVGPGVLYGGALRGRTEDAASSSCELSSRLAAKVCSLPTRPWLATSRVLPDQTCSGLRPASAATEATISCAIMGVVVARMPGLPVFQALICCCCRSLSRTRPTVRLWIFCVLFLLRSTVGLRTPAAAGVAFPFGRRPVGTVLKVAVVSTPWPCAACCRRRETVDGPQANFAAKTASRYKQHHHHQPTHLLIIKPPFSLTQIQ